MSLENYCKAQVRSLTRDVGSLAASLQREQQRRAAAAAYAKEMEATAADTEQKLRQVQYANRRLEEEVRRLRAALTDNVNTHAAAPAQSDGGDANTEREALQAEISRLRSELDELRKRAREAQNVSQHLPPLAVAPTAAQTIPAASNKGPDVDAAMQELQAVVPQYRGAITALQGRIKVLQGQYALASQERDALKRDAAKWREAAEQKEAAATGIAAKLHSLEAAAMAAAAESQSRADRLQAEVATLTRRCHAAENDAETARIEAQRAQESAACQAKVVAQQADTIAALERTVREQQDDILAALDLVCHRSSPLPKASVSSASKTKQGLASSANEPSRMLASSPLKERNCRDQQHNMKDATSGDVGGGVLGRNDDAFDVPASPTALLMEELENASWTIPAANTLGGHQQHHNGGEKNAGMAALAADIEALRDALRNAL